MRYLEKSFSVPYVGKAYAEGWRRTFGSTARIAWASDLHFDIARPPEAASFFDQVRTVDADMLVLCGDISDEPSLGKWLHRLELELDLPVRFVLGNHDAYHGSLAKAHQTACEAVARSVVLHEDTRILSWLSDGVIEILSDDAALIGHDGWYDMRQGLIGNIIMNDFRYIDELKIPFFTSVALLRETVQGIADQAVRHIDEILPKALERRRRVVLATHVPPFPQASWYGGRQSDAEHLPYYCSVCVGNVLVKHMEANPDKELLVLCGHTHGEGEAEILPNLRVLTAKADYGFPRLQGVIEV